MIIIPIILIVYKLRIQYSNFPNGSRPSPQGPPRQAVIQVSQSREEFEGKEADLSTDGDRNWDHDISPKSNLLQCEAPLDS